MVRAITRLNVGGPARQALLLTRRLRGDFPTTLVTGTPPPEEGELSDPEVLPVRVPLVRPVRPATDVGAYRRLRAVLAETRPVIVHTHMAKAGLLGRQAAVSARSRPRIVHTFHGHVLEGYFSGPVTRAFVALERRMAARTDVLVAVSDRTRDDLLELGIGRPDQYRVIPLGLDLDAHLQVDQPSSRLRAALGVDAEVPLVGALGRLVPIKDVETLLSAVQRLPGVHLAVLGDGPLRSALEAAGQRLGVSGRVHFAGWWRDIPAAMADLDVVVLSSRNEGTPVSLIEAAACAVPVVATDVGGVATVVEEGKTGYLVPAGEPDALAERIGRLLGDRGLRTRMGNTARAEVAPRFGADRLVDDIRALYRELLGPE
ncbi:MAG TPA: glycosyltransferase [Acidimicrobiales bacterium]|nr:glycosyltransferase [Acidimicrobiales bacterium]